MANDATLTIEIKNKTPVELIDLTKSLSSFADEYKRYLGTNDIAIPADEIKLYIKEIRTGSIIADLVALAPYGLPFAENANTIMGFSVYLKSAYEYLTGKSTDKPQLERNNYQNLSSFIEPVAKDNGSQINCHTTINGNVEVTINLTSSEANAAQNIAKKEIDALAEPITGIHDKVLLYWYQARNDLRSTTGDKAIIESLYSNPVKVIFDNESIKMKMLSDPENIFVHAYIVDVSVETIKGKPAVYKITNVHEKIDRNES